MDPRSRWRPEASARKPGLASRSSPVARLPGLAQALPLPLAQVSAKFLAQSARERAADALAHPARQPLLESAYWMAAPTVQALLLPQMALARKRLPAVLAAVKVCLLLHPLHPLAHSEALAQRRRLAARSAKRAQLRPQLAALERPQVSAAARAFSASLAMRPAHAR